MASADKLYLPVDSVTDAPTVEAQENDPASLLNTVKALLSLRRAEPDMRSLPNLEILYAETGKLSLVYKRGGLVMAVNPSSDTARASSRSIPCAECVRHREMLIQCWTLRNGKTEFQYMADIIRYGSPIFLKE